MQPPYGMAAQRCALHRSEASRPGERGVHQLVILVEKLAGDPYQQTDVRANHGLRLNNQQPGLACLAVPRLHDSQPGLPKKSTNTGLGAYLQPIWCAASSALSACSSAARCAASAWRRRSCSSSASRLRCRRALPGSGPRTCHGTHAHPWQSCHAPAWAAPRPLLCGLANCEHARCLCQGPAHILDHAGIPYTAPVEIQAAQSPAAPQGRECAHAMGMSAPARRAQQATTVGSSGKAAPASTHERQHRGALGGRARGCNPGRLDAAAAPPPADPSSS